MKRIKIIVACLVIVISLSACNNNKENRDNTADSQTILSDTISNIPIPTDTIQNITNTPIPTDTIQNITNTPAPTQKPTVENSYDIKKESYSKGKYITIKYPQMTGLADTKRQDVINAMLKKDAMSHLTDASDLEDLNIDYEVMWKGDNILSIHFWGTEYYSEAAHPNGIYLTTNIDINTGKQITLQDLCYSDQQLVENVIRKSSYEGPLDNTDDIVAVAMKQSINSDLTVSKLMNNEFYLTEDSLGICLEVAHVVADYASFEIIYEDILDSVIFSNDAWDDFAIIQNAKQNTDIGFDIKQEHTHQFNLNKLYQFTIFNDQSFQVNFKGWGDVNFVSGKDFRGKLVFFLTDNKNNCLYQFPDYYASYWGDLTISAIAFRDLDENGRKDVIIITEDDGGYCYYDIYFQIDGAFVEVEEIEQDLNISDTSYNTVNKIIAYMKTTGKSIAKKAIKLMEIK